MKRLSLLTKRGLAALKQLTVVAAIGILPLTALAISDVANLQATAGDASVNLSWQAAAGARNYNIYYGTEPVAAGEAYNLPTISTPDTGSSYTVTGLTNGITYYFSVTATDAAGESANYSQEVSATPQGTTTVGATNSAQFKVNSARALDSETLVVTFSEPINLPTNAASLFAITYSFNETPLTVSKVEFAPGNSSQTQVVVTTMPQEPGGEYILVLPASLTSKEGDTLSAAERNVIFLGSQALAGDEVIVADAASAATGGFGVTEAEVKSPTEVVLTFNADVVLPTEDQVLDIDPFTFLNNNDPNDTLEVLNYTLDTLDPKKVVLTVAPMQTGVTYTIVIAKVKDTSGNDVVAANSTIEINNGTADTTPPVDATNLKATLEDAAKLLVALTWTHSLDQANDLVEYVLYQSTDGGVTYQQVRTLGKDTDPKTLLENLQAETEYTFKLTAKDASGNESVGVTTKIVLPETGPGIAALAFGSLFSGRVLARRRKQK